MTRQSLPIALAITLGLSSFLGYPTLAQIQISTLLSQTPPRPSRKSRTPQTIPTRGINHPPPPPRTPQTIPTGGLNHPPPPPRTPPDNQTKPGGGLNPSNPSCKSTSKPLTALIPVKNPVLTTREHPTFLFYVPYGSDDVRLGEFSLLVGPEEKTRIYKTRLTLPQTAGIVSITLPSAPEYALEEGQYYHWYLKVYCQTNTSSQPSVDVNGWVQRVALTPELKRQIKAAAPDVWYDALANLALSLRASPHDARLRNNWVNLLKSIGSEDLAQEPLVGPVIPSEK